MDGYDTADRQERAEEESIIDKKDYQRLTNLVHGSHREGHIDDEELALVDTLLLMQLQGQKTGFSSLVESLDGKVSKSRIAHLLFKLRETGLVSYRYGLVRVDDEGRKWSGRLYFVPKSLDFEYVSQEEYERRYIERWFPE